MAAVGLEGFFQAAPLALLSCGLTQVFELTPCESILHVRSDRAIFTGESPAGKAGKVVDQALIRQEIADQR
jgi:hypothetical protein